MQVSSSISSIPYNSTGPKIRYAIFGITTFLYILILLFTIFLPGFELASSISLWIQVWIGLLMIIYYPFAIYLSIKNNSRNRFDQVGGEVAIGVLLVISWLAIFVFQMIMVTGDFCQDTDSGFYTGEKGCQASQIVITILSIILLLLHLGWTTWLIVLIHQNTSNRKERDQLYKLPSHHLVKGKSFIQHISANNNGGKRILGSVDSEERGLYNHRL
ncbi:uncharacterized protein L201_006245 [Kwoniella dendrophila CBS 6074]|uniref:MARVEL domain-containing protein n=1 Tax=Kwoniella dendrophila CBS 6074 TaxID=1295534 RepID=A0AAX4K352_9TREE